MNLKARLSKLELVLNPNKSIKDMTYEELEERIRALQGMEKGEPVPNELLLQIINEEKAGVYGKLE